MSLPTDPSHPLIQRLLNEAVASHGGWTAATPSNTFEAIQAFIHAIHWRQPFFLTLLALHLTLLGVSLAVRHRAMGQLVLLGVLLAGVSSSEWLNAMCKRRWRELTSEDYFDQGGIFTSLVWSTPLAVIGFMTLLFLLYDTSSLLVVVKRKQLQLQRKAKGARTTGEGGGGGAIGGAAEVGAAPAKVALAPQPAGVASSTPQTSGASPLRQRNAVSTVDR